MEFEIIDMGRSYPIVNSPKQEIVTDFEKLNPSKEDGYPKVKELSRVKLQSFYKVNIHDEIFHKPLKN